MYSCPSKESTIDEARRSTTAQAWQSCLTRLERSGYKIHDLKLLCRSSTCAISTHVVEGDPVDLLAWTLVSQHLVGLATIEILGLWTDHSEVRMNFRLRTDHQGSLACVETKVQYLNTLRTHMMLYLLMPQSLTVFPTRYSFKLPHDYWLHP